MTSGNATGIFMPFGEGNERRHNFELGNKILIEELSEFVRGFKTYFYDIWLRLKKKKD